jgi:hypothetical protein
MDDCYEGFPDDAGYSGYEDGGGDPGGFYGNEYLDTAVSTNPGGDEGYIALGDGDFVSFG